MSLRDQLIRHEGLRLKPYRDSVGKLTIGVGRNLDDSGISEAEALHLLDNDIAAVKATGMRHDWFRKLDPVRKDAILNMAFNMGWPRLLGFRQMIAALERMDYEEAAREALASKWADQVGNRAREVSEQLRTGVER